MNDIGKLVVESKNIAFYSFAKKNITNEYLNWIQDPEVNKFLDVRFGNNNLESLNEYVTSFNNTKSKYLYAIYNTEANKHIGNASIINISLNHEYFKFGYFIGVKDYWGTSAGLETILLSLKIGFDFLNMRKCTVDVYSNNIKGRFLLKKVGFYEEGSLKEHLRCKDRYVDNIILSLGKNEWLTTKEKFSDILFNEL